MERKIREIFEFGNDWYQCVESDSCGECSLFTTECRSGTKSNLADKVFGQCSKVIRTDNKHVVFKKLEKVGEPYEHCGKLYQCYKLPMEIEIRLLPNNCNPIGKDNLVEIEIKQKQEDMKEKNLNLKPFDLEAAKAGKPVCTRDGRKARIICFDRKLFFKEVSYPILALVERSDGEDDVCAYNEKGKVLIEDDAEYKDDIMMIPEKKEGWVNVYNDNPIYDTKERAELAASTVKKRIGTFKIFWEE